MRGIVERLEALLDRADGPGLLFDADRNHAEDRVIKVAAKSALVDQCERCFQREQVAMQIADDPDRQLCPARWQDHGRLL